MFRQSITQPKDLLEAQLKGTRISAFFNELLTNSGYFLIFNAFSEISLSSWIDYLIEPTHYLIAGAIFLQAWYLAGSNSHRFWGNLIGPFLYTISDLFLDGMEFFHEPNHYVLWLFSLAIATLQGIRFHWIPSAASLIIPLESLSRTFMIVALYMVLSSKSTEPTFSWEHFRKFSQLPTHKFLIESMVFLGLILGLQTARLTSQRQELQKTAQLLRNLAEWGMGSHAVLTAVTNPEELAFQRRDRTIVFMDIRGFTAWCEQTAPDTVASVLNSYYRNVEPGAAQYQPLRITLTADEIMAIYATPQQGIAAAKYMCQAAEIILKKHGLGAGCALHCGDVIEGLFGSKDVRTYTVIGDVVNTAKRLESATPAGAITISDEVYKAMPGKLRVESCEPIMAKGKTEAIKAWRLLVE
ncbi:adenylate/guanylate cyclase domain-containing protein [Aerosakkonemataceae cyanobacterium BLCC-F154]|uniref:Adenylate/guanylate cyclase domain-containing protein n=1 Tax=Floridaenema fluviatile BLCC-F154 TaxID=3153640 RepID=A0ABV4Y747_9CYAN